MRFDMFGLCLKISIMTFAIGLVGKVELVLATPEPNGPSHQTIDTFESIHDRAVAAFMEGKFNDALRDFTRALEIDRSSALAFYNRGNVRYALKDAVGAIADYSEAIKLRQDFGLAYMNRGSALSDLWRLDEALADLGQAIRYEPTNADTFYNRAVVYLKRNELRQAMADYDDLLKLDRSEADKKGVERLKTLMGRQDSGYVPDDPARLTTELAHGRKIEFLMSLVERSCLTKGSEKTELAELANDEGWKAMPTERLEQEPNSDKLLGAWMFQFLNSAYYVIQSAPIGKKLVVCSVSSMPVSVHLLEDMKALLSNRFRAEHSIDTASNAALESRYTLPGPQTNSPLDLRIVYRKGVRFITVRVMFPK